MNIDKLFSDKDYLERELDFFLKKKHITKIEENKELASSFLKKAKHDMEFFNINKDQNRFNDWLIVVLYYSLYHSSLALITNRNYSSKNHYGTILILIKEYSISKQEAHLINELSINKSDAELYSRLKSDRHKASYSTDDMFGDEKIRNYEKRVLEFVNKTEEIIEKEANF